MQPSATAVGRALRRTQAAALSGPQGGDEAAQSLHRTFSFTRPRDGSEPPHRGVVYRAIQWHEIVQLVGDGSTEALAQLGRLPEDVLRYRAYRTKVRPQSGLRGLARYVVHTQTRCCECSDTA